jgi:hypothetical protein
MGKNLPLKILLFIVGITIVFYTIKFQQETFVNSSSTNEFNDEAVKNANEEDEDEIDENVAEPKNTPNIITETKNTPNIITEPEESSLTTISSPSSPSTSPPQLISNPPSPPNLSPISNQCINKSSSTNIDDTLVSLGENIVDLYRQLLLRQPVSSELSIAMTKIRKGVLTLEGLRRQLIDTDEYSRMIKLQSNELNPELKKMISDQEIITYVANIYNEERKRIIPNKMELPLRDLYIYIDYNDYALRAMLRDSKYITFEQNLTTTDNLTKPILINIFLKFFNVEYLIIAGVSIFANNRSSNDNCSSIGSAPSGIGGMGGSMSGTMSGSIGDSSGNYKEMSTNSLFNKDLAAIKGLSNDQPSKVVPLGDDVPYSMTQTAVNLTMALNDITTDNKGRKRIPIHKHDMVLIPEFAWSVPQEFPQVCTTLGQKPLVQPVMNNSALLLGTPLDDANNTQVGSIMPKFEYKEYITIPN